VDFKLTEFFKEWSNVFVASNLMNDLTLNESDASVHGPL